MGGLMAQCPECGAEVDWRKLEREEKAKGKKWAELEIPGQTRLEDFLDEGEDGVYEIRTREMQAVVDCDFCSEMSTLSAEMDGWVYETEKGWACPVCVERRRDAKRWTMGEGRWDAIDQQTPSPNLEREPQVDS